MTYRENAAPKTETIHSMTVRRSKGTTLVALVFTASLLGAVSLVVLVFASGPDDDVRLAEILSAVAAVVFGVLAIVMHTVRRRTLRIERTGERLRVVIDKEGVAIDFPIACHGTQMQNPVGRVPMYDVYLQIVGAGGAILLKETRGAAYGPVDGWPNDIDRSVKSTVYNLSSLNDASLLRGWIEALKA